MARIYPKYDDKSLDLHNWTKAKLTEEARAYDGMIYESECYGIRDLQMLRGILNELNRRGITVKHKYSLEFIA